MTHAERFASVVSGRVRRDLSTSTIDPQSAEMTGLEVIAILRAVVAACDQFNPGWRDQALGLLDRILPPWNARTRAAREEKRRHEFAEKLRDRASRAMDPEELAWAFDRAQARRDQAVILNATRSRMQSLRDATGLVPLPDRVVADAILESVAFSDDATISGVIEELAPR